MKFKHLIYLGLLFIISCKGDQRIDPNLFVSSLAPIDVSKDCNQLVTLSSIEGGGTGPYSTTWVCSNGASGPSPLVFNVGSTTSFISCTATVTDANGCTLSDVVNITVNDCPCDCSVSIVQNGCNSVTAIPSSGCVGPISYQWFINGVGTGLPNTQTIPITVDGSYTVLIEDADGCNGFTQITVSNCECTDPVVTIAGDCDGFTVNINGTCPSPTYQWFLNGAAISGATSSTYDPPPSTNGFISVQVICGNGCDDTSQTIFVDCPDPVDCNCTPQLTFNSSTCSLILNMVGTGCNNYNSYALLKYNNFGCSGGNSTVQNGSTASFPIGVGVSEDTGYKLVIFGSNGCTPKEVCTNVTNCECSCDNNDIVLDAGFGNGGGTTCPNSVLLFMDCSCDGYSPTPYTHTINISGLSAGCDILNVTGLSLIFSSGTSQSFSLSSWNQSSITISEDCDTTTSPVGTSCSNFDIIELIYELEITTCDGTETFVILGSNC